MPTPRSHEPAADPSLPQVHPDDLLAAVKKGEEVMMPDPASHGVMVQVVEPGYLPATVEADAGVLAMLNSDNDPWAGVGDGDLAPSVRRIPYLKINRNMDGGFTVPDTGETVKDLDFIWMAKGMSRAWFKDAFGKGESVPGCRSADGVTADPQSPDIQNGGQCVGCPMQAFEDDKRPGGAPRCREGVEALVFLPDPHGFGQLARMRWNGIAVQPAKRFWDSFFTRMPKVPPIGFVSHVTLEATDTAFGQKLAPVFHRQSELGRQEAQPLIVERDARMRDWVADTAADLAEGVGQDDETGTGAPQGDPFGDPADDYQGPDF